MIPKLDARDPETGRDSGSQDSETPAIQNPRFKKLGDSGN